MTSSIHPGIIEGYVDGFSPIDVSIGTDAWSVSEVLYFLTQSAPRDYPRLKLRKGAPMCKVLADSLDELIRWGRRHGLRSIHFSRKGKPHYDLWGTRLGLCPHFNEMKRHRDIYRTHFMKKR